MVGLRRGSDFGGAQTFLPQSALRNIQRPLGYNPCELCVLLCALCGKDFVVKAKTLLFKQGFPFLIRPFESR